MRNEWLLLVRFCTELKQTALNTWYAKDMGVRRFFKKTFSPPWKLELRTKFSRNLDVSSSIPINWFISCNSSLLASVATHTAQSETSERYFTRGDEQGRNNVRWRPGQEASFEPPYSNLRPFGSKYTVLKRVGWMWHCWDLLAPPAVIRHSSIDLAPG